MDIWIHFGERDSLDHTSAQSVVGVSPSSHIRYCSFKQRSCDEKGTQSMREMQLVWHRDGNPSGIARMLIQLLVPRTLNACAIVTTTKNGTNSATTTRENKTLNEHLTHSQTRYFVLNKSSINIWTINKTTPYNSAHTHTHTCRQLKTQVHKHYRSIHRHIVDIALLLWTPINNRSPVYLLTVFITLMFNITIDSQKWIVDNDNRTNNHCIYSNCLPFMKPFK